jgi:hypothetical protein
MAICLVGSTDTISTSWYPLNPGNTWIYRNEALEGNNAHPDFARWSTEETIVSAVADPRRDGTLITKRTRVFDHSTSSGFLPPNDPSRRIHPESHLLIRHNCIYDLEGIVPDFADYCFPITRESTWGQTTDTSPAYEFVWTVLGFNADPFGIPGGKTWHFSSHQGSGTSCDRWFEQGVGLLQQVTEHHGTYDEQRKMLVSTTIHGKTVTYNLKPAK